jgi:ectoine hydroxylase
VCGFQPHYKFTRPEWIAHRDFTPIKQVGDDALYEYAHVHRVAAE